MIEKHPSIPITSVLLFISEETLILVYYDDIPLIIKQLKEEGKLNIYIKDDGTY